jgi:outer membrane protein assembly factor BamB
MSKLHGQVIALTLLASLSALTSLSTAAERSPWPRFRGPEGSGIAVGSRPPAEIGPETNVKWKVAVPSGLSSPIIASEYIVVTALDDGKLFTIAYRRKDGQEAWRADARAKEIEPFHKTESSPAASTSATDGERIVSYFGSCGLVCYDLSGKELWRYDLPTAMTGGGFGSGVSPILADGVVILVRDEFTESRVLALDAATGALLWQTKRQSPMSYGTPIVCDTQAGKQVVAVGHGRLSGYDLKSGEEKWSVGGVPAGCCPSPITADGLVLFAGGASSDTRGPDDKAAEPPSYDKLLKDLDKNEDGKISREEGEKAFKGFFDNQDANKDGFVARDEFEMIVTFMSQGKNSAFALKPGGSGDVTESHVVWQKTKGLPYIPTAIAYGGQYVMIRDGGVVTAYDPKRGDEIYQKRVAAPGTYYASPVAAAGNIYFTSLQDGIVTVIKTGAKGPEVVATNPPLGERVSATPAIADDTLYIRTAGHLYAFAEK